MFPQDALLCKALKHEYSAQIYEYLLKVLTPRLLIDCFDLTIELYPWEEPKVEFGGTPIVSYTSPQEAEADRTISSLTSLATQVKFGLHEPHLKKKKRNLA